MHFITCNEPPKKKTGKKVAIIGAGPGGLAAAGVLICRGHDVDVYDMQPEPGGMLIFGIPDIRLNKDPIKRGIKQLEEFGVRFICNTKVGKDIPFDEILGKYDGVIIATGAWEDIKLNIPGSDANYVYHALEFLEKVAKVLHGHLSRDKMPKVGKRVVVIGGGDTAVDCALVAQDMGAEVIIAYRRTKEYMPAKKHEVELCEKKSIKFMFLISPSKILKDENNNVRGVEFDKMMLGAIDTSGRPRPIPTGKKIVLECDTVIFAIGERVTLPYEDPQKYGIRVDERNRIIVDENFMTSRKGVFAVGDVVTGPKDIASALKAGKIAANALDKYLRGEL